jgi:tetratricopeptide (TPR) repeat protein
MESADDYKNDGNEKYKQKRYKEAISSYSRAIELEPENTSFYLNRAAAQLMLLNYKEVICI